MQILPQGPGEDPKVFVGYGLNAVWTEFNADGSVLCDVHFAARTSWERGDMQSYRAYKQAWTGMPEWPPSVDISDDDAEVYVSWLGATDVAEWVLQCADKSTYDEKAWADLVRVPKHYFETTITLPEDYRAGRYMRVIALAADGRRLDYGTSAVIDCGIVATYFPSMKPVIPESAQKMSVFKVFMIVVANVSMILVVYEGYRRYLGWRLGTPSAGAVRWRKGPAYRILGDA